MSDRSPSSDSAPSAEQPADGRVHELVDTVRDQAGVRPGEPYRIPGADFRPPNPNTRRS